jgi:hypothetical protein
MQAWSTKRKRLEDFSPSRFSRSGCPLWQFPELTILRDLLCSQKCGKSATIISHAANVKAGGIEKVNGGKMQWNWR